MLMIRSAVACAALLATCAAQAVVVNIDATHGFTFDQGGSDPAPLPGQHINPIGARVELALPAGNYVFTNAYADALPQAQFSAWSYNVGTSSWAWSYLVADAATDNVIFYNNVGLGSSAAAVAALPAVQSYSRTLTLAAPTTLLFTLRDYYVPDNDGGISVNVASVSAVPEPENWALMLAGIGMVGVAARRRAIGGKPA